MGFHQNHLILGVDFSGPVRARCARALPSQNWSLRVKRANERSRNRTGSEPHGPEPTRFGSQCQTEPWEPNRCLNEPNRTESNRPFAALSVWTRENDGIYTFSTPSEGDHVVLSPFRFAGSDREKNDSAHTRAASGHVKNNSRYTRSAPRRWGLPFNLLSMM